MITHPTSFQYSTFQSTPPARGATSIMTRVSRSAAISIHAPREGGDLGGKGCGYFLAGISIHAPREGGDSVVKRNAFEYLYFNPRPPRGGRRGIASTIVVMISDFNPRPPRGGRLQKVA